MRWLSIIPLLIACGGSTLSPTPPPTTSGGREQPAAAVGHRVRVESTGAGPRHRLRYRFKKGNVERLDFDMALSTEMVFDDPVMGGKENRSELPTIRTRIRMTVANVKPNGDATLDFEYEDSRVAPEVSVDESMRNTLDETMKGYIGLRGRLEMNSRGATLDVDLKAPVGANPTIVSSLDQMRESMRTMYVPFPEEPVGVGAKWDVSFKAKVKGIENTSTFRYNLLEVSDTSARLGLELAQQAESQPLDVGVGMKGTLLSLSSTGAGRMVISPTSLAPTTQIGMKTAYSFTINDGKNELKVNASMVMTMSTRPSR